MIDAILGAMVEPFTKTTGWQAFAYGVTGRVIVTYARNFYEQGNEKAANAAEDTEEDLENE
jgi:hypothetical protein